MSASTMAEAREKFHSEVEAMEEDGFTEEEIVLRLEGMAGAR